MIQMTDKTPNVMDSTLFVGSDMHGFANCDFFCSKAAISVGHPSVHHRRVIQVIAKLTPVLATCTSIAFTITSLANKSQVK